MAWIAHGFSNREIGERIGIAENTVKVHVSNLLAKLKVRSRLQLALAANRFANI